MDGLKLLVLGVPPRIKRLEYHSNHHTYTKQITDWMRAQWWEVGVRPTLVQSRVIYTAPHRVDATISDSLPHTASRLTLWMQRKRRSS